MYHASTIYNSFLATILFSVPRQSGLMNEREKAICSRVRDFRESIKWPQPAFAQELGLSRDQLASIEYGRTPLRFGIAATIARVFDINLEWLVTGNGPRHAEIPLVTAIVVDDPRRDASLLSQIYDREPNTFTLTDHDSYHPAMGPTPGFEAVPFIIDHVIRAFQLTKFRSPHEAEVLARAMCQFCDACLQNYRRSGFAIRNKNEILGLPEVAASGKLAPVKSQLKNLLADLNRLTTEAGMKTKLADFLGAPLTSVSRWLSGEREPGGETTLKMLRWVQEQESQPNAPGSAINTAKGKATRRKVVHEKKPTSSHKQE
jgi:transcriptional regulator with XRE-family HTH domain